MRPTLYGNQHAALDGTSVHAAAFNFLVHDLPVGLQILVYRLDSGTPSNKFNSLVET